MNILSNIPAPRISTPRPEAKTVPADSTPADSFSFSESYADKSRKSMKALLAASPVLGGGWAGYKLGESLGGDLGGKVGIVAGAAAGVAVAITTNSQNAANKTTAFLDSKLSSGQQAFVYGALEVGIASAVIGVGYGAGIGLGHTAAVGFDYLNYRSEQKKNDPASTIPTAPGT